MTTISHVPAPILSDDPFGLAVLDDPLPFHERLREAGRIAYVPQYDLFVMGRYDDVHAGLTDWQTFQSAAGVGLSNFRKEKPWRPPSLLPRGRPPAPRRTPSRPRGDPQPQEAPPPSTAVVRRRRDPRGRDPRDGRGGRRPRHRRRLPAARVPRRRRPAQGRPREPPSLRRPHLQLVRAVEPPGRARHRSTSARRRPGSQLSAPGRPLPTPASGPTSGQPPTAET